MGYGKINVWIRDINCRIVENDAHLHVMNCHGEEVIPMFWFTGGHTEVELPPGCYIIRAGVYRGNVYTDKSMVVVQCGKTSCVNLVLTEFVARNPPPILDGPIVRFCPLTIAFPTILHGLKKGINFDDLRHSLEVIGKAANIDISDIMEVVKREVEIIKGHIEEFKGPEQDEAAEIIRLMQKIK